MRGLLLWVLLAALVGAAALWLWLREDEAASEAEPPALENPAAAPDEKQVAPSLAIAPPPGPKIVEAKMSSGVAVRLIRPPRIEPPSAPYGAGYEALRQAAEKGEPVAQYRLGLMLYRCRDVPADEAALSGRINQVYQTRQSDGWDVDDPAQEERGLRQDFADCRGVPSEVRGSYRDWMKQAAESGLIEAQLDLMFHLPKAEYCQFIENCTPAQAQFMAGLREEARLHVTRALQAGSVEALRTVGGWALNDEMGSIDEIEAYAHFSAYDQIQQGLNRERELGPMLARLKSKLRPVDIDQAEARARELLSNPKCCVLTR
ncbi:MAG: hypothetical protein ACT4PZ_23160 [Panacagrimonas sp.]